MLKGGRLSVGTAGTTASPTHPLPRDAPLIVPRLAAQKLLTVRKQLVPLLSIHDDARQWSSMPVADDPPRSTLIEHFHSDHGRFGLVIDVFGPFEKLEERLAG